MDLEQLEAFALAGAVTGAVAENREAALKQLVPGTQEYYFLHCLHYQHTGDLTRSFELLERWVQRHGHTSHTRMMSHRQTLLSWPHDPRGCVDYLRQVLGLHFDHAREVAAEKRALPARVDPARLDRAALMRRALDEHRDLAGFTDAALDWLAAAWESLDATRRHQLLARLQRPDHPGMVALVLADLTRPRAEAFGSLPIHRNLLLAQLDALAEKRPALRDVPAFVHAYVERLQPGTAEDLARDPAKKRAYLERLWAFVSGLAPVFASLQAHVLYHWLALDRSQGRYDRERFLAYLRLPRQAHYVAEAYLVEHEKRLANLHEGFPTGLEPVGDDEPLVREYLAHLLVDAEGYEELAAYVREDVLRQIFATAKLLAGKGDAERWYALLDDPAYYQALKDRVDIELAPTNPPWFGAAQAVALDVDIKNVPTLVIKIYEIDTLGYYTREDREIDTDIDLDGLPASQELVHTYEEPPLLRRRARFALDALARPGIYVIDFIGNGKSSRALVRKGRLGYVERHGAAGHVLTVLDEDGRQVRDASVWLGGREYAAREDGTILIPYSTKPGQRTILLRHGDLTVRERLHHLAERYDFSAGFYVEREALVPGNTAEVIVRPRLSVHGTPVSLSLLSSLALVISTTDRHGVRTSKEVADFEVHEDRESIHEFRVPADLTEVRLALRAKIRSVSEQRDVEVAAEAQYEVNGQDRSAAAEALYLRRTEAGFVLDVLGKSGEPRAGVALELSLQHRDFARPVALDVQTDAAGRVFLGPLDDIVTVSARPAGGAGATAAAPAQWPIWRDRVSVPRAIHVAAGEDIAIPYLSGRRDRQASAGAMEDRVSLLERRGNGYRADWGRACTLEVGEAGEAGYLRIRGLPAGDYELWLARMGVKVDIRVAATPAATAPDAEGRATPASWLVDAARLLGRTPRTGLQVTRVQALDDVVEIRLAGITERTRVHVFGVRFVTPLDQAGVLAPVNRPAPGVVTRARGASHYVSGRRLGDEYRYVLERKQAAVFPGVMLERPRLLLNPWAVRKTETGEEQAREGSAYAAAGAPPPPSMAPARPQAAPRRPGGADPASVDFVAAPALTRLNVRPERAGSGHEGVVSIERAALGHAQLVRVVAVDDGALVVRELGLPDRAGDYRDLRLAPGLDPQAHVVEKHRISVLGAGAGLELANRTNARWEVYDTLRKVFELFAALSENPTLSELRFVLDWPRLSGAEKRERYSKYACHELHLFLSRKDPAFFDEVVRPYLRNKKDKTFLDHYLLGDDVSRYRELWAHGRLNTLERILLAQRLPGEGGPGRRHIDDQCELLGPDPERDERLFRTALQRGALDSPPPPPMQGGPGEFELRGGAPKGRAAAAPGAMAAPAPMMTTAAPKVAKRMSRGYGAPASMSADDTGGIPADMAFGKAEMADMAAEELAEVMLDEEASHRDRDVSARGELRRLYRAADRTEEWAENNYYRLRVSEQGPELIPVNAFWRDFAHHESREGRGEPFTSAHVALATSSFAEMMCALAVLDLPFEAGTPEVREAGQGLLVRTAAPSIVFHEELATVAALPDESPVQVQQHYLRFDDRFDYEGNEPRAKYVTGALFTRTVYACEVVLGNVTPVPLEVVLLWQIPAGAMAVGDGFATRSQRLRLEAYQTRSLEYCFYFPAPGTFTHFPAHVARGEAPVAAAPPRVLAVIDPVDEADTSSWAYVSQHGSGEAVVAFLASHNVLRLDLSRIAWRMEDRNFYDAVLSHLEARRVYDRTLWSYALAHQDARRLGELLRHEDGFLRECGPALRSPLIDVEPVARGWYEHLEYAPLIHARAHVLGGQRKILNQALAAQYRRFLDVLVTQAALSGDDLLAAAYYLLLQDRVAEGLEVFGRVDASAVAARLQYDYMAAVVALYRGDAEAARKVALAHAEHAVDRWRKRFTAVVGAADEAMGATAGGAPGAPGQGDAGEGAWLAEQGRLAESEQSFDVAVEGGAVVVSYQNLAQVEVRYYLMDIELAFSRAPFVSQATERFALVKPHGVDVVALPADRRQHRFTLPAAYARRNVVVEVIAAGTRKAQGHYAHDLLVHVAAPYGQVKVYEQAGGRPLPRSYVKVYARMRDGEVRFYKDGYTDLRGCFDYASLSTDALDRVARFAMLVISQEHGAMIREAAPPQQ